MNIGLNITKNDQKYNHFLKMIKSGTHHHDCNFINVSLEKNLKQEYNNLKKLLVPKDIDDEKNAILEIRAGTGGDEAALFSVVLMKMYPSLIKQNFNEFSKCITEMQNYMGKYFNKMQGGKYSSAIISKIINFLKKEKTLGYGQTSWGPTGFAFFSNNDKAKKIKNALEKKFANCNDLEFIICSGKNTGANIKINI